MRKYMYIGLLFIIAFFLVMIFEPNNNYIKTGNLYINEILSSKIEEDVLNADNESNLLAASGSEDVLGIKTIVPSGEHCQDIRDAIDKADDGDIIDLQGKTFTIVDNGDTVVVIEHNLDIIKVADHIIDLGPEGGDFGGKVIAAGTPEEVSKVKGSYTGDRLPSAYL